MKSLPRIILLSFFLLTVQYSNAQSESGFAIVKMTELSAGGFGSNISLEIYYENGEVVDGKTLIKDFQKNKWLENFSYVAFILSYMERNGYVLVTSTSAGIGQMFLNQYIFRKKNK